MDAVATRRRSAGVGDRVADERGAVASIEAVLAGGAGGTAGATTVEVGFVAVLDAVATRRRSAGVGCGVADEGGAVSAHDAVVPVVAGLAGTAAVDIGLIPIEGAVVARGGLAFESEADQGRAVGVVDAVQSRCAGGARVASAVDVGLISVEDAVITRWGVAGAIAVVATQRDAVAVEGAVFAGITAGAQGASAVDVRFPAVEYTVVARGRFAGEGAGVTQERQTVVRFEARFSVVAG